MSNATFFVDPANSRLIYSQYDAGAPALPAWNAGDTINFNLFFLDGPQDAFGFRIHRYAGSDVKVRLRAGGTNTVYALSASAGEVVPSNVNVSSVAETRQGSNVNHLSEIQTAGFATPPASGNFTITFHNDPNNNDFGYGPFGTTGGISSRATAADIQAAIRALPKINYGNGGSFINVGPAVVTGTLSSFVIDWTDYGRKGLVTLNKTNLQWGYGWSGSLPLTAANFNDLFLAGNAPAYLEVLLDGNVVSSTLLPSQAGDPGSGGGAGTNSASLITGPGVVYDGDFNAATPVDTPKVWQDKITGSVFYKQAYLQLFTTWQPLPFNTPYDLNGTAILVDETEPEMADGGLVRWERTYCTVPGTVVESGSGTKTFKQLNPTYSNGAVVANSVITWSQPTETTIYRSFKVGRWNDSLPQIPDVIFYRILNDQIGAWAAVGGFLLFGPGNAQGNNFGHTFLEGSVSRWLGDIWEKRLVYSQ